jgi:hypothetical protein
MDETRLFGFSMSQVLFEAKSAVPEDKPECLR